MEVDSGGLVSLCEDFSAKYATFFVSTGATTAHLAQLAKAQLNLC